MPSGLKSKRVTVRIYEWQIEAWYANRQIKTLPRIPGANHFRINYWHVTDTACYANRAGAAIIAIAKTFSRLSLTAVSILLGLIYFFLGWD